MRLVLRGDADAADAGVERVGQREIDDARLAAEIDGRLGAPVGQFLQAAAAAAGQHIGHGVARQRLGSVLSAMSPSLASGLIPASNSSISVASGGRQHRRRAGRPPSRGLRVDHALIALAASRHSRRRRC